LVTPVGTNGNLFKYHMFCVAISNTWIHFLS
jgi:hypothetical protein